MADIINFNSFKEEKAKKFIYKTWLELPIVVKDDFKQGDIIVKESHIDNKNNTRVNYYMPTLSEIKQLNKFKQTVVPSVWTSIGSIEKIICEHDCPDIC